MSAGPLDRQRGIWETPECPFRIEYAAGMLNQIRMAAVEAYYSVPRGGVEIGGVLFGSMEPGRVVIRAFRRIECEYASGPSFALSERDLEGLERVLRESETNETLGGQRRVGWFHTHTRSEVCLTQADVDIHDAYFPGPMEVALVLRPAHLQPTRAGFFFRDATGHIHADRSLREFIADSAHLETFAADEALETEQVKVEAPSAPKGAFLAERPVLAGLPSTEPTAPPTVGTLGKWVAAAAMAGVLASGAITALWPHLLSRPAAAGLGFEALELGGQTVLRWNRQTPIVEHAAGGLLSIGDGGPAKEFALQPEDVRRGVALYRRTSEHAEFRLRLWQAGQPPVEETQAIAGAVPEPAPVAKPPKRKARRR